MSKEMIDRIQELLLEVAALRYDLNTIKAELEHERARAEAYEAVLEGTHGEGVDNSE